MARTHDAEVAAIDRGDLSQTQPLGGRDDRGIDSPEREIAIAGDQWAVLLTSYRRDGTPVGTPVSIAVDGDRAFIRSPGTGWKVKRMRNNPRVEIAPCTARGRVLGLEGSAGAVGRRNGDLRLAASGTGVQAE